MNWDTIAGKWKEVSGSARQRWGNMTDSDWEKIAGKKDELVGHIQKNYGKSKDEADRDVDEWSRSHSNL